MLFAGFTSSMVQPSGGELMTNSVPMLLLAPGFVLHHHLLADVLRRATVLRCAPAHRSCLQAGKAPPT